MLYFKQWIPRRSLASRALSTASRAVGMGVFALSLATVAGADPSRVLAYTLTDLGSNIAVSRINNRGQVVGTAGGFAFLYDGSGIHNLGALPGGQSSGAAGINEAGVIVGSSNVPLQGDPLGTTHAFLYDSAGMHDLGTLPGGVQSQASGINEAGHVVGISYVNGRSHAFLYSGGVMQDLGVPPNGTSVAAAINASGEIVGTLSYDDDTSLYHQRAFVRDGSGMHELGTVGGYYSEAAGVNDAGQVAGTSDAADGITHVFLYDVTGMHDLGVLPGGTYHHVTDINGLGQIVGGAMLPATGKVHAFLYSGGKIYDLNNLLSSNTGAMVAVATGINDVGQIVAFGEINGREHAMLLTPTPAPVVGLELASVSFPVQPVGVSGAPQTVRITNVGGLPLTVGSIAITGDRAGEFAIAADSGEATLAPGAARTIQITFTPALAGSRGAALTISDNDPTAGSPRRLPLAGTGAPEAPGGLTVRAVSPTELDLSWSASIATAFAVWRLNGAGNFERVGVVPPTVTTFADRGLKPGTPYIYRVRAIYYTVASSWSEAAGVTLPAEPAAPSALTASVISPGEIDLAWTRGGGNETGISIFRQTNGGPWQRIGVVAPTTTRYADRSAKPGMSYLYRVRAHNDQLVSPWTNEVGGRTPAGP